MRAVLFEGTPEEFAQVEAIVPGGLRDVRIGSWLCENRKVEISLRKPILHMGNQ
jgi:hypothetical protein